MTVGDLDRWAHGVLVAATAGTSQPPAWLRRRIGRGLGGVCLFGRNIVDTQQVRAFTDKLRAAAAAEHPGGGLLVAVDEEGGDVTRLHSATGSPHLGPLALGVVGDPELTRGTARGIGRNLVRVGVDWTFAPVADLNVEQDSPVIGVRSFGTDPNVVAAHVASYIDGLHDAGVLATAKHFPGHGATAADSHTDLPHVRLGREQLERTHLPPFAAAAKHGVDAVMLGHLLVEAVDPDLPASLSSAAVRLLREEVGFTGAVVTDALEMRAVAHRWTIPGAAVLALSAGADALCLSGELHDEEVVDACARAIVAAVHDGILAADRLAAAAAAVQGLRRRRTALKGATTDGAIPESAAGEDATDDATADRSLRVRGDVTLDRRPYDVLILETAPNLAAGSVPWHPGPALAAARPGSRVHLLAPGHQPPVCQDASRGLVLVVRDLHRHQAAQATVARLVADRPDAVVVEMGVPVLDPGARGWLCSSGASAASAVAVARRLLRLR